VLRHRVKGYRPGDLEHRYEALGIAEHFFVNYGFVIPSLAGLMNVRCAPVRRTSTVWAFLVKLN
jgi:hypothetical protein